MKINDWLSHATQRLEQAGIGSARLDTLILLEDTLGQDRSYILAHPETELDERILNLLSGLLDRRSNHEPLAYIRSFSEFYGRKFTVNNNVLEPRPESETMIEILKSLSLDSPHIADIGTGSGALAITAKLEIPQAKVNAVDIDPKCLLVARKNAADHNVDIKFFEDNLFEPFIKLDTDVLLCNLPYVPDDYHINQAASMEPRLAIFGGADGLEYYRTLFKQIATAAHKPKYVLAESLPPQHKKLAEIASASGYKQKSETDFIQLFSI